MHLAVGLMTSCQQFRNALDCSTQSRHRPRPTLWTTQCTSTKILKLAFLQNSNCPPKAWFLKEFCCRPNQKLLRLPGLPRKTVKSIQWQHFSFQFPVAITRSVYGQWLGRACRDHGPHSLPHMIAIFKSAFIAGQIHQTEGLSTLLACLRPLHWSVQRPQATKVSPG